WQGTNNPQSTPIAIATGLGILAIDPIPIDYNDLYMLGEATKMNPRWRPLLESATDLLLDSQVPFVSGLFYNGYQEDGTWTGDFENRDTNEGNHLKTIQTLWIALHLARASQFDATLLDEQRRSSAQIAAKKSLDFFKDFYTKKKRVPEYLTVAGLEVKDCVTTNVPDNCLTPVIDNSKTGEVRIYALLARLALLFDDKAFAHQLINDQILTDRISDPKHPRYGQIGISTASEGDADAWSTLESVLTLCLESSTKARPPSIEYSNNQAALSKNLALFLPAIDYQIGKETHFYSANLEYIGTNPAGDLLWTLKNFTPHQGADLKTVSTHLSDQPAKFALKFESVLYDNKNYWAELDFIGNNGKKGDLVWKLRKYGVNETQK
ncbi:MAG: hypothetical protein KAH08_03790, partial [Methylococcales bacterium]|nr:hypothetical protein [Methylococcales bacterium]